MPSLLSNQVKLVAAVFALCAAQNCVAQTPATEESEKRLREEFVNAVVANPALHGVWVDVRRMEPNAKGNEFALDIVVDSRPQIEISQRKELSGIIKGLAKSTRLEEEPNVIGRLPFRQLVDELKLDVELSRDLGGAAVDDAYYSDDGGDEVSVILVGRVLNEGQREKITQMSNAKISKLFGDSVHEIKSTKTKTARYGNGIVQTLPSSEVASFCFDLGLQRFTGRSYAEAYVSFTRAHLESPLRLDIQYWRVVSLLGTGRDPDAKRILEALVEARPRNETAANQTMVVCRSLEPVQGPLRWKLIAMENSLFCKTCN